nr:hypothetical protein [Tanacetum cinerariifolium]
TALATAALGPEQPAVPTENVEPMEEQKEMELWAEDLAQERLPNIFEQRQKEQAELMMRMTEADWLNLMIQPAITEPSAKRQRVEEPSSQPATVSATSVSATAVSAAPRFTDSTVITTAAMDSAVTRSREFFLDSDEEMPPGEAFLCDRPVEDFFSSDSDSGDDDGEYSLPYSEFQDWEVVRCPPGNNYIHVYHREMSWT